MDRLPKSYGKAFDQKKKLWKSQISENVKLKVLFLFSSLLGAMGPRFFLSNLNTRIF
jgi:hypothetical protein